jgi:hypothetical protein
MNLSTLRNQASEYEPTAMTYWKRRFLALVVGLSVLALVAWAFSGALGSASGNSASGNSASRNGASRSNASAAAGHSVHAAHGRPAEAGAATSGLTGSGQPPGNAGPGAVAPGTPSAPSVPSASARPSASPSASPSAGAPSEARKLISVPAQAAAGVSPGQVRACRAGDVVLSLFSSQDSYRPGQLPQFDVDVVSTVGRPCSFNVSAQRLALAIKVSGKQVWNSADCATGRGALTTELTRGVPTIVPISWSLRTSAPGCAGRPRAAPPGHYTAFAADGRLASNRVRFTVLSRPRARN